LRAPVIQLNPSSIAKVCFTDEATVTAMLNELLAQIGARGASDNIRVNLQIGVLHIKQGMISFIQSNRLSGTPSD